MQWELCSEVAVLEIHQCVPTNVRELTLRSLAALRRIVYLLTCTALGVEILCLQLKSPKDARKGNEMKMFPIWICQEIRCCCCATVPVAHTYRKTISILLHSVAYRHAQIILFSCTYICHSYNRYEHSGQLGYLHDSMFYIDTKRFNIIFMLLTSAYA